MLILTLRTDKPEAEIGLYDSNTQLAYHTWTAHRALAETLLSTIQQQVSQLGKTINDVQAMVVYRGPGSFTGLRIGISVANALAHSLRIPIVGIENEVDWLRRGLEAVADGQDDTVVTPEYGAPVHITAPRK